MHFAQRSAWSLYHWFKVGHWRVFVMSYCQHWSVTGLKGKRVFQWATSLTRVKAFLKWRLMTSKARHWNNVKIMCRSILPLAFMHHRIRSCVSCVCLTGKAHSSCKWLSRDTSYRRCWRIHQAVKRATEQRGGFNVLTLNFHPCSRKKKSMKHVIRTECEH